MIESLNKNKNKVINGGVILLAIIITFYLFGMQSQQLISLEERKNEEIKRSQAIESLMQAEKKMDGYKQTFKKIDLGSVINAMTDISKDTSVKVISVKPGTEQRYAEYLKSSFVIVVAAVDYHALGEFISKIENYKDLFIVEEVNISVTSSGQADNKQVRELEISLKVSTITCL